MPCSWGKRVYDLEHRIRSTRSSGAGGGGGLVRSLKRHRAARAAAASGSGGRGTLYSRATKRGGGGGLLRGSSLPVIKLAHVGGHRHRPTASSSSSSSLSSSAEKRGIKLLRMLDMRCEVDLASLYISIFVNWEHSRGGPSFEHRRGGLDHSGEEGGLGHRIRRESGEEEEGEEIDIVGDVSRE